MRVLYVDDDRVNSLLFAELCRLAPGVQVDLAGTAEEAVDALTRQGPDLLVLDLHLPDGDGLTLLPRLRRLAARALPAYLCSADEPEQVQASARQAGFDGCWSKPLNVQAVLADLMRHAAQVAP